MENYAKFRDLLGSSLIFVSTGDMQVKQRLSVVVLELAPVVLGLPVPAYFKNCIHLYMQ